MSAAAPTVDAGASAPKKKGKKKLIIIVVAVLLLVAAGVGAMLFLKKPAHDADASDDTASAHHGSAKPDLKHPPTFLPLDPFVVNLADKDSDRYAQIGITLEVEDAKFAEEMKAFMPAIRNGILLILAHKSSQELLDRAGKEKLAAEIQREASRTMGLDVDDEPETPVKTAKAGAGDNDVSDEDDAAQKAKAKARKRKAAKASESNPIRHVHFANFIVQ